MVPAAHFAEDVLPCYLACGVPGGRNKYSRSYFSDSAPKIQQPARICADLIVEGQTENAPQFPACITARTCRRRGGIYLLG
jgi:hypothetical protein